MQAISTEQGGFKCPSAWNEAFSTGLIGAEFRPLGDRRLSARLACGDLGPLRVARLSCNASVIERGEAHAARGRERAYLLIVLLDGKAELRHFGQSVTLGTGDMVLCDAAAPLRLAMLADGDALLLRVPAAVLREHLPSPECFCARPLAGAEGVTSTAIGMAVSLFDKLEAGLAAHYQERVWRHLLDMIATAYVVGSDALTWGSSIVSGRRATVTLYIEQNLRDPDLSPCTIAKQLKLSPRYLRMIFAPGNETVSAYILRRRLEECARQIADPSWRGYSMTEIAFGWGFNSAPHFTRSFRERYAMSPREYRRMKLGESDAAPSRNGSATGVVARLPRRPVIAESIAA